MVVGAFVTQIVEYFGLLIERTSMQLVLGNSSLDLQSLVSMKIARRQGDLYVVVSDETVEVSSSKRNRGEVSEGTQGDDVLLHEDSIDVKLH
ncbi:hypothetical protein K2173_012886 [Erythroxylum novogranatense]|uniref:Uncharacterized protein n=1 Tax=Erythroxylum novogranatense TaxID=1862640 RepID=A0AAV8S7U8_9ROSI|nr:hypothetical protein K2173_012886 [Erythroxylum novogranatense]